MPINLEKIVLVRPQGGLNDTLMQIEKCCQYAEKTGRKVVVDTNYHGSTTFHDAFSNYFQSLQRGLFLDTSEFELESETDVYPRFLSGKLASYCISRLIGGYYREFTSLEPITFDFQKNYSERVVVHHQLGGGDSSTFFQRVMLNVELKDRLSERLTRLQPYYTGIHIRNTDYRTNFRKFIEISVNSGVFKNKKLFLATDSEDALIFFKQKVTDMAYLETTRASLNGNQPIHNRAVDDRIYWRKNNSEAILDLLTLAYSSSIIAPPIENFFVDGVHVKTLNYSGFVKLAQSLKSNRALLTRFTSIQGWLD